MSDHDEAVRALYALPLEDFTAARNELAKRLKSQGDDRAADVGRLKKPTLPAWAVNQLAHRHPKSIEELIQVRAELAAARNPGQMRSLGQRRLEIVGKLGKEAESVLREGGHSAGSDTLQKINRTLLAAAGDEEELLRNGTLTTDLAASGFGEAFGFEETDDDDEEDAPSAAEERARAKAQKLEAEAEAAAQSATELEREAERLRKEAEAADDRASRARRAADRARAAAESAWKKVP